MPDPRPVADGAAAGVRLVLCEPGDAVAASVCHGLAVRGLPATIVTSVDLVGAARWEHRIASRGETGAATVEIELADGRVIRGSEVHGVVNRLAAVPPAALEMAEPADRLYADHEWRSLLVSVLHALAAAGVPVLSEAHPYSLRGRWRSPAEWAVLADAAGFEVPRWRWEGALPAVPAIADAGAVREVLVIGESVFDAGDVTADGRLGSYRASGSVSTGFVPGVESPEGIAERALDLARLAATSTLGMWFESDALASVGHPPRFLGADATPDLRRAGEPGLDALAMLLP